jgi:pimeloyl-ACP methyl ester carboxylesterase
MDLGRGQAIAAGAGAAAALGGAAYLLRGRRMAPVSLPVTVEGRERTLRSHDGTEIHVREFGPEQGPPLVLVHAWMCSTELWHRQIDALSGEARIVSMDLRGHGRSGFAPNLDYSIESFGDDLQCVLEASLEPGERAVIAGHSMGAMTVAAWAHRHHSQVLARCRALAMIGTGLGDLTTEALVLRTPDGFERWKEVAGALLLSTEIPFAGAPMGIVRAATRRIAFGSAARDEDVALVAAMAHNCPRRVRGRSGGTLSTMDVFDGLVQLDVPATVIAGEEDRMTPPVHSHKLAERLPAKPAVTVVPRAGHMLPLEAADVVTAELRALLACDEAAAEPASATAS